MLNFSKESSKAGLHLAAGAETTSCSRNKRADSQGIAPEKHGRLEKLNSKEQAAEGHGRFRHGGAEGHHKQPDQLEAILENVMQLDIVVPIVVIGDCQTSQA